MTTDFCSFFCTCLSSALLPFCWGRGTPPVTVDYRKTGTLILTSVLEDLVHGPSPYNDWGHFQESAQRSLRASPLRSKKRSSRFGHRFLDWLPLAGFKSEPLLPFAYKNLFLYTSIACIPFAYCLWRYFPALLDRLDLCFVCSIRLEQMEAFRAGVLGGAKHLKLGPRA